MNMLKTSVIMLSCFIGLGGAAADAANKLAFKDKTIVAINLNPSESRFPNTTRSPVRYSLDDGVSWHNASSGNSDSNICLMSTFNAVRYLDNANQFIIVGHDGAICYSSDGMKWRVAPKVSSNFSTSAIYDFVVGNVPKVGEVAVAVGQYGGVWYATQDKSNEYRWQGGNQFSSGQWHSGFNSIAYGAGNFVEVGDNGWIGYSTDQVNWNQAEGVTGWENFAKVVYFPKASSGPNTGTGGTGAFIAIGTGAAIWQSVDGKVWNSIEMGTNVIRRDSAPNFVDIACAPLWCIVVGDHSVVITSTEQWNYRNPYNYRFSSSPFFDADDNYAITSVIYSKRYQGFFITYTVSGNTGGILFTKDTLNWKTVVVKKDGNVIPVAPLAGIVETDGNLVAIPIGAAMSPPYSYVLILRSGGDPTQWQAVEQW